MLRRAVLVIGVLTLAAAAICLAHDRPRPALWLTVNGLALTLGLAFERWRYGRADASAPSRFIANGERFFDPESGALIEVREDPSTGERRYVALPPN